MIAIPAAWASRGAANDTSSSSHHDPPRVRPVHAGQHLEQRRLARAVLADERVHLAGAQVEIDAAKHRYAEKTLGDAFQPNAHDQILRGRRSGQHVSDLWHAEVL